ncbi:MAG: hypothetical protein PHS30_02800, partial [Bacteroidales bacterium]|nr:hypothetical protein [Bacteroidales bacterium]
MNISIDYYGKNFSDFRSSIPDFLIILILLLGLVVIAFLLYRRYLIRQCYIKEYWLPIVDDGGNVIGRVARSVSIETPGVYQHPLIRILVNQSGTIYLTPRTYEF